MLQGRVDALCSRDPGARSVIQDVIKHITGDTAPTKEVSTDAYSTIFTDLSMILPERRKVSLGISEKGFVVLLGAQPLISASFATYNVALCLPVPKRPKPTWNLLVTNMAGAGPWVVLTIMDVSADKHNAQAKSTETLRKVLCDMLKPHLKYLQSFDNGKEQLLMVKSYIGAKEGILYLMKDFVFFGFKKPLILITLAEIEDVSFTVVTRLTFNVVFTLADGVNHEFGMISHDYYDKICQWIASAGINDRSLAEEHKAKRFRAAKDESDERSLLAEAAAEAGEPEPIEQLDVGDEEDDSEDDSEDEDYTSNRQADSGGSGESSEEESEAEPEKKNGDEREEPNPHAAGLSARETPKYDTAVSLEDAMEASEDEDNTGVPTVEVD